MLVYVVRYREYRMKVVLCILALAIHGLPGVPKASTFFDKRNKH